MKMFLELLWLSSGVMTVWAFLGSLIWWLVPVPYDDRLVPFLLAPPLVLIAFLVVFGVKHAKSVVDQVKVP